MLIKCKCKKVVYNCTSGITTISVVIHCCGFVLKETSECGYHVSGDYTPRSASYLCPVSRKRNPSAFSPQNKVKTANFHTRIGFVKSLGRLEDSLMRLRFDQDTGIYIFLIRPLSPVVMSWSIDKEGPCSIPAYV